MSGDWLDPGRRIEKARRLYHAGQREQALHEVQCAIAQEPVHPDWYFDLGLILDAMGRFEEAIEAYREAATLAPTDLEARNRLGVDLLRMGRLVEAIDQFEQIERLNPAYEPSYCNRIITYAELGDHERAETMFYLAQQVSDQCPASFYNIGHSLFRRGEYDRAIDCWRRTLQIHRHYPRANRRLAEAYLAKGDPARARKHYLAELYHSPRDVSTLIDLAELLIECDRLDEAERKLHRVMDLHPGNLAAQFCWGRLAMKRGQWAAAEGYFLEVLNGDPTFPETHLHLGELLLRRGQLAEAQAHLLKEAARPVSDPCVLQHLGRTLLTAHLPEQAGQVLERLAAIEPDNADTFLCLAAGEFMRGRLDEGIAHCQRALQLRPGFASALYNLALAYERQGRLSLAQQTIEQALAADPKDDRARLLARRLGARQPSVPQFKR